MEYMKREDKQDLTEQVTNNCCKSLI